MNAVRREARGLLATPGFENQPPKGVYFFAGDPIAQGLFTSDSDQKGRDYAWTDSTKFGSDKRNQVVTDIDSLGANVIFAAYYGDFSEFLFLSNSRKAFMDIFYSSRDVNGPLIVPSLETIQEGWADGLRYHPRHLSFGLNWHQLGHQSRQNDRRWGRPKQVGANIRPTRSAAICNSDRGSRILAPKCPRGSDNIEACNAEADKRYVQSLEDLQAQVQLRTGGQRDGRTGVITGGILIGFVPLKR